MELGIFVSKTLFEQWKKVKIRGDTLPLCLVLWSPHKEVTGKKKINHCFREFWREMQLGGISTLTRNKALDPSALSCCRQSPAWSLNRLASGSSPVAVKLDGKVGHDLQGLVGQLQVHGDGAHLAGEGTRDLQPLGLHGREPYLQGRQRG